MDDAPDETLLTVREVAKVFRVDEKTIRRWTAAGEFAGCVFRTPGGQLRYRAVGIAAIVNARPDRAGPAVPLSNPAGPAPNQPTKG